MRDKVLIVENDSDLRAQLKSYLLKDFDVIDAGDIESAIDLFNRNKPQVVTIDIERTFSDKEHVCLREILDSDSKTKLVLLADEINIGQAEKYLQLGAYDYYLKPVDMKEFIAVIHSAARRGLKDKEPLDLYHGLTLKEARRRLEIDLITRAISKHHGNIKRAAEDLGISRPTLYDLIQKHHLPMIKGISED